MRDRDTMKCKDLKVYVENLDCYMLASLQGCLQKWIDEHQECEVVDFREIKDRLIIFYKENKVTDVQLKTGLEQDYEKLLAERGLA